MLSDIYRLSLLPRHKVFISYRHTNQYYYGLFGGLFKLNDSYYKNELERAGLGVFISKSVQNNDINPENKDSYIKRLIQENHINDTTVLIVLVGPETSTRKHVDWEISAALDYRVGNRQAGLIGIILPSHPNYNNLHYLNPSIIPQRLYTNFENGYASVYHWGGWIYNKQILTDIIDKAFYSRKFNNNLINKTLAQFINNRSMKYN